jgi:hypothetical protein
LKALIIARVGWEELEWIISERIFDAPNPEGKCRNAFLFLCGIKKNSFQKRKEFDQFY